MSRRPRIAAALAVSVLTAACTMAEPPVPAEGARHCLWKVTSDTTSVYLLGSIHALAAELEPLPTPIEAALDAADVVVFEVDLDELDQAALSMLGRGTLADGRTLADVVSPETLALVNARLEEAGLDTPGFDRMKPWMLALTLMSFELLKAGFDPDLGVDALLFERAQSAGKGTEALETVDFQLGLFDDMPPAQQEQFLVYTLNELDEAIPLLEELTDHWLNGRGDRLADLLSDGFDDFPDLERRIVTDRNRAWLPTVERHLAGDRPVLMVVGTLHLVGAEGVIELLRGKGYTIEQQ